MSDTEKKPASAGEAQGNELSDNQLEAVAGGDIYGDLASMEQAAADAVNKAAVAAAPYVKEGAQTLYTAFSNALPQ